MAGYRVTMRKIVYFTGTRADFGLMRQTLLAIHAEPSLDLGVAVTGMHLSQRYGLTVADIEAAKLRIDYRIPVPVDETTGSEMARNLGTMVIGFTDFLSVTRPDIVLLLGDRGEMLAAAIAALHLNIAIAHIHGGERSGTIDEPVRHAISKLSHFHFVTEPGARDRLIAMGERADMVTVVGAPGVEGLSSMTVRARSGLCADVGFDPSRPIVLFVYHPVVQEADTAAQGAAMLIDSLVARGFQIMALKPNSDAGGVGIARELDARSHHPDIRVVTHFPRDRFIDWMAASDLMCGNTSAGIIEAASFGTPVINVGSRQQLRARNSNTIDTPLEIAPLESAIDQALAMSRSSHGNIYEQPDTSNKIVNLLCNVPLNCSLLNKVNSF
jgi:GDP/UDP-N,N'-diacetylbacillosamine 2-epimerase (hydrolysing)